jgi:hypothetical protein
MELVETEEKLQLRKGIGVRSSWNKMTGVISSDSLARGGEGLTARLGLERLGSQIEI